LGMKTRQTRVGRFTVIETSPALAIGFAPIPTTHWIATASEGSGEAANVIDRDAWTGWSTKGSKSPGQWLAVDLGKEEEVARVDLLAIDWRDVPSSFRVEVSRAGEDWQTVQEVASYWGPLFVSEHHPFLKVRRGRVQAIFPPVRARRIRIVQTGEDPYHAWSLRELLVYRPDRPAPPVPQPEEVVAALRRENVRRVYTNHWLGALVGIASRGDILIPESNLYGEPYGRTLPDPSYPARLPPFVAESGSAILLGRDADRDGIVEMLARQRVPVRAGRAGPYELLLLSPPPASRPLSRDGWQASASDNSHRARRAIDNDGRTRWVSASPPRADLTFTVDLGRLQEGWTHQRLRIEASTDGGAWYPVGPLDWGGQLYWSGSELLADGRDAWDFVFPPTLARYLRLNPGPSPSTIPWVIEDIQCFGTQP
ncbi:MAG: hypothetical protein DMD79_26310, partial [Candidatus Rokuibacteriota bacterium]